MTTSKRSDAYAIWYMPETTYGVDPGIVAAVNAGNIVDGSNETYLYVPTSARAAYARIVTGSFEGAPKRKMVEAEGVMPITDADNYRGKAARGGGEPFSFDMLLHGGLLDSVGTDSDRPVPPPWAQLATSASGRCVGFRAGDTGGGNGPTNSSKVKASQAPTVDYLTIEADAGTIGSLAAGHVFGVDHGTGTSTPDIELVRPVRCETTADFGDSAGATAADGGAVYNGSSVGFKQAPTAADRVYFSSQVCFDRRYEDSGAHTAAEGQLSFTFLVLRPEADSCQLITGVRCNEFEITENIDEYGKIKLSFHYKTWLTFGEDGATAFGGTPAISDEPAYYGNWPCPKVCAGSNMTFLKYLDAAEDGTYDTPTVVRDFHVTNFSVKWNAGYTVRRSNMSSVAAVDLRQTQRQTLEVKFTALYHDDWRDMLGLCSAVDGTNAYNTFPFIYWSGEKRSQVWFVACPSLHLREDPGPGDVDFEGNQAQEIVLGSRPYRGDRNAAGTAEASFSTTTTAQNKFAIGTL